MIMSPCGKKNVYGLKVGHLHIQTLNIVNILMVMCQKYSSRTISHNNKLGATLRLIHATCESGHNPET